MSKAAVLGAGSWGGTAFAKVLADAGTDVTMWARRGEVAESIVSRHENTDYLPGIALPPSLTATDDARAALDGADIVVLAVPSQSLRDNLQVWSPMIPPENATLLSLAKGIETGTLMRMSQVIIQVTGADPGRVAVLSGPNLAREIAIGQPAATVVACTDSTRALELQKLRPPDTSVRTRIRTSSGARSAAPARTSSPSPAVWHRESVWERTRLRASSLEVWPRSSGWE